MGREHVSIRKILRFPHKMLYFTSLTKALAGLLSALLS